MAIVKIKIDSRRCGCLLLLIKTNCISYNVNYIRINSMNGGRIFACFCGKQRKIFYIIYFKKF